MKVKFLVIALAAVCVATNLHAQTKPVKPVVKPTTVKPYKVPKMSTMLGQYKDSLGLPREEVLNISKLPLRVVDEKGVVYAVTAYQVAYRQRTVSETEDGKAIPASGLSAGKFYQTPLPERWINFLAEELKKGEELFFFDIIAKDPQGRVMYAPTLKISVL